MSYPWHSAVSQQLIQRYRQQSLHHALLFAGEDGIGKRALAELVCHAMLCHAATDSGACGQCSSCKLIQAGTHPDRLLIESEKQIGVDLIRGAIAKLSQTAQQGGNKVLIIEAADSMTEAAANALLKTLEEPTKDTYLILLTARAQHLLPTILSRCEKVNLALPAIADSMAYLHQQGLVDVDADTLAAYGYAPLRVERAMATEDNIGYRTFVEGIEALQSGAKDELQLAEAWQTQAGDIVMWSQQLLHQRYREHNDSRDFEQYQYLSQLRRRLQNPGVNKVLLLSDALRSLSRK